MLVLEEKLAAKSVDFFKRDLSGKRLNDSILPHREHAVFTRRGAYIALGRVFEDDLFELLVHLEYLEDRGTAAHARGALLRRRRAVERLKGRELAPIRFGEISELLVEEYADAVLNREGLPCSGTELAHQPLADDRDKGRGDQIRVDAHINEARDSAGRGIGVNRREDEVAGQGRLGRKLSGLFITNLSHHDDVRVLAKYGAQS